MPAKGSQLTKKFIKQLEILHFCEKNGRRPSTNRPKEKSLATYMRNYIKKSSTSYDRNFDIMMKQHLTLQEHNREIKLERQNAVIEFCEKYGKIPRNRRTKGSSIKEGQLSDWLYKYYVECPKFKRKLRKWMK